MGIQWPFLYPRNITSQGSGEGPVEDAAAHQSLEEWNSSKQYPLGRAHSMGICRICPDRQHDTALRFMYALAPQPTPPNHPIFTRLNRLLLRPTLCDFGDLESCTDVKSNPLVLHCTKCDRIQLSGSREDVPGGKLFFSLSALSESRRTSV